MKKAEFQLEPLTCPSCIKKIESTLSKTDGVDTAKVLFNASKVKSQFDETQIDAEQIKDIIVKLGYAVLNTKVN